MLYKKLPRNKNLKQYSRNLRKNATKQERHLWYDYLRKYPLQFYRQRIIGAYIVDFYCPKAKLVVELDGSQHYKEDVTKYDDNRTLYLNGLGLKVIRFSNLEIDRNFQGVCNYINKIAMTRKIKALL